MNLPHTGRPEIVSISIHTHSQQEREEEKRRSLREFWIGNDKIAAPAGLMYVHMYEYILRTERQNRRPDLDLALMETKGWSSDASGTKTKTDRHDFHSTLQSMEAFS